MSDFQLSELYPFLLALAIGYPVIWLLARRLFSKDNLEYPPSPPKLPILGNIHQVGTVLPHYTLWRLSKQYGTFMFLQFGIRKVYVVQSAALIKELVKEHDIPISNRPPMLPNIRLWYGLKGLITMPYSDHWKKVRNIFINQLLHKKRAKSFNCIRDKEIAGAAEKIGKLCSTGATINLSKMISLLTCGTVCKSAFGEKYGEGDRPSRLIPILEEMEKMVFKFTIRDFVPSLSWINKLNGFDARLEKLFNEKDEFIEDILREYEQESGSGEVGKGRNGDHFIDVLLDLYRGGKEELSIDRETVKASLQDAVGAGTGTTSTALSWAMTELLRHPDVMKKLQDEVRGIMKERQQITDEDLDKMQYLKAVLKETLRKCTPVPLIIRETTEDIKLRGYTIPAGAFIWISLWAMGHDPTYWDEPQKFKPERFLDSTVEDFQHMPFGFGRRICPGMSFAHATMERVLANLVHKFDWALPNGAKPEELDVSEVVGSITLERKVPLIVVAKKHYV